MQQRFKFLQRAVFAAATVSLGAAVSAEAQPKKPKAKPRTELTKAAQDKVKYTPDADLLEEMIEQIKVVESNRDWTKFNRQRPISNRSGKRSAYIAQFSAADGAGEIDVIVVHDRATNKFYEIRGFDYARPFENLRWTTNDTLEFDQWVNPRRGGRYGVNLKTAKLVAAGYIE